MNPAVDWTALTARELRDRISRGEIKASEACEASLARVGARGPKRKILQSGDQARAPRPASTDSISRR